MERWDTPWEEGTLRQKSIIEVFRRSLLGHFAPCRAFCLKSAQGLDGNAAVIPFLHQDGNEKAIEQRRDSTKEYGEEPHSAAAEVNI